MKTKYAVINYPCPEEINALKRNKIIAMVHGGMDAVVGKYGTSLKALKKILKKYQHDTIRRELL